MGTIPREARVAARIDLAGRRLTSPIGGIVYLVDPAGYRRRIKDDETYARLFRDRQGIVMTTEIGGVAEGADFTSFTILVRGDASARIYLLDDGCKRFIPSGAAMDKYWFNWGRICVVRQALIDHVRAGEAWQ
jgi:hypothetical protein